MAHATLSFPAFFSIEGEKSNRSHRGQVCLARQIEVSATTAAGAAARLVERVQQAVRHEMDLCRALSAVPDRWTERVERLEITAPRDRVTLPLRVLYLETGDQRWAILPRPGLVLALPPVRAEQGPSTGLQSALDSALRKRRPSDETVDGWADRGGDRVEQVEARVELRWPPIEPALDLGALLQSAGGSGRIDGRAELEAVGENLVRRYPDRLRLDRVPHPLTAELRASLFHGRPEAIVVLGPAGAGRTTLVHGALYREINADPTGRGAARVPPIWHVDPNRVISGQSIVGAWQRRFQAILGWLAQPDPDHHRPDILYLDNAVALARIGRSRGSELTLSTMLRPWIEQRRLPVVLEATPEEWRRLEELDRPLTDLFRVLRLSAPAPAAAARMVLANVPAIEAETGATISPPALRELLALSERNHTDRALPGAPLDTLGHLARRRRGPIEVEHVRAAFAEESGLDPAWLGRDGTTLDPAALRARVAARLAGQPEAVDFLVRCLLTVRAGLPRPGRPIATALLVGPTGVGKTETARVLAATLFNRDGHLLRFDMGELVDADAPRRLIGDLFTEGLLTSRVRHKPTSVVLFDEIEKAHPDVLDLLLQVLDEGRLTDGRGQRADFQRTIVLMTSNVGAAEQARTTGFQRDATAIARGFRSAAERHFRPEFINRVDEILAFSPLSVEDLRRVAALQTTKLLAREGLRRRTVFLDLGPAALDRLATAAAGSTGARALKRAIERDLAAPLAEILLDLPADAPLRLRARADAARFEAHPIPFSPRRIDPDRLRAAPDLASIRAALESIRPAGALLASAGPAGTTLHGTDLARQIEDRLAAYDESDAGDDDHGTPLTEAQLRRIAGRRSNKSVRSWGYRFKPDLFVAGSYSSVRQYLLAATAEARGHAAIEAEDSAVPATERALAAWQIHSQRKEGEQSLVLRARGLATETPALWTGFARWVEHIEALVIRLGGRFSAWRLDPVHGRVAFLGPQRHDLPGERQWQVHGAGLRALLASEVGAHALWVDDDPPLGLQVDLPASLDATWPEPEALLRLYLGRATPTGVEIHEVSDVRLDRSWPGLDAMGEQCFAHVAMEGL